MEKVLGKGLRATHTMPREWFSELSAAVLSISALRPVLASKLPI
jgi:hypothetical protein